MGVEFPFGKTKRVLKMDGGDGSTSVNVLSANELYT